MPEALDWQKLAGYAATAFPHGWNKDEYVFFSPRDQGVHQAIVDVITSAGHSVLANHYGFDDDEISELLLTKAGDPDIAFMLNLDSSQAGGVHEKRILADWQTQIGTSVAVGRSIKHAISHLKVTVVDGLYVISGSTNLSASGETLQDNECRITRDALLAARYSAVIMLNHAAMQQQMAAAASR